MTNLPALALLAATLLTPDQALERALTHIASTSQGNHYSAGNQPAGDRLSCAGATRGASCDWSLADCRLSAAGSPAVYVFSRNDSAGFIVVPADVNIPSVLAYSDAGMLDTTVPGVEAWLQAAAEYTGEDADSTSTRMPVAPLLSTRWNQTAPYNSMCPMSYNRRSMTGCVATAMAQVVHSNRYASSSEIRNYMDGSIRRSFDFSVPFEWDLMPDQLTESSDAERIQAVGRLMLGCGLAVNTSYAWNESGAYNEDVPYALTQYFGYNPDLTVYAWRSLYSNTDWDAMIYSELSAGRPLYYAGGIHAFVLDGVDANGLYHFNWGWGGASDGYFSLLSLAPGAGGTGAGSGNFTDKQLAVRAIPGNVSEAMDIFHVAGSCTHSESGINTLYQLAGTPYDRTIYPYLIVQDSHGQRVYTHRMGAVPLQAYGYSAGRSGQALPLSAMALSAGEYRVYPGVALTPADTPTRAYAMPGAQPFILLTVAADGSVTYSNDVYSLPDIPETDQVPTAVTALPADLPADTAPRVRKYLRGSTIYIGNYTVSGELRMQN